MVTVKRPIDTATYKELISMLDRIGVSYKVHEPNTLEIDHTTLSISEPKKSNDDEDDFRGADYDELESMFGMISTDDAERMKEELKRSREEDWD